MAPKKKEVQKLSLGDFLQEQSFGSWADEVEDTFASGTQPLPPSERRGGGYGSGGGFGQSDRLSGYAVRDSFPTQLPTRPPFTAHLGNLSYDATSDSVSDFFAGCEVVSVRIVEDREQQRPKGFGYVEFTTVDGLKQALTQDGDNFEGRNIRIRIADPPKNDRENRGDPFRELDWSQRKGPLADLPRSNDRRPGPAEFGGERREYGERRMQREPTDDGKSRDFSDWSRKGPLSPRPEQARPQPPSRDGSRPPTDGGRGDSFGRNNRRDAPAWGEGRPQQQQQQEGSRPPRREFADRPERVATAAEKDMQWRTSMRPDAPVKSPAQSRSGSEAPPSPAPSAAVPVAPAGRPKLNLTKRTVSDSLDVTSPALPAPDTKASPFGAARPIDSAAKEREIAEKREKAVKDKKEADEKAKEERRQAKEAAAAAAVAAKEAEAAAAAQKAESKAAADAAAKEEAETAAAAEDGAKEASQEQQQPEAEGSNGPATEQKIPTRPREQREPREPREPRGEGAPKIQSRANDSGNWRSSGEHRGPRGAPAGPRRGGGAPRGPRQDGPRPLRANGGPAPGHGSQPSTPITAESEAAATEEDGWTTVKKTSRK